MAQKKQIATGQTEENIKEVLQVLKETPMQLERLYQGLSKKQLHEPLGKGERSFVQTLAHILNCEALTSEAIHLALLLKEPALAPIHAERDWGKLVQYEQFPFDDLLGYFKFRRRVMLAVLGSLNGKAWSRTVSEVGKQRKESVYWRARGQALHELEHTQDLEKKLNKKI